MWEAKIFPHDYLSVKIKHDVLALCKTQKRDLFKIVVLSTKEISCKKIVNYLKIDEFWTNILLSVKAVKVCHNNLNWFFWSVGKEEEIFMSNLSFTNCNWHLATQWQQAGKFFFHCITLVTFACVKNVN